MSYPGCKRKFQIVRAKSVVLDGSVDGLLEQVLIAEEVLGHPEPDAEKLETSAQVVMKLARLDSTGVEQIIWS